MPIVDESKTSIVKSIELESRTANGRVKTEESITSESSSSTSEEPLEEEKKS